MTRILCWLGLHRWSAWHRDFYNHRTAGRYCTRRACQQMQLRKEARDDA